MRAQARLTAVAELLEAPVFPGEMGSSADCNSLLAAAAAAEDGYCSLCRRCQMRRKLEKRLQQKKLEEDDDSPVQEVADERTIKEIMEFIGEDTGKGKRRKRRRRRKRGNNDSELSPAHDFHSSHSTSSGNGCGSSVEDHELAECPTHNGYQDNTGETGSEERTHQHACSSHNGEVNGTCCENHSGCDNGSSFAANNGYSHSGGFDEITPEQEAEIEKEVEEFRLRLACHPPAQDLPRIAIPNL